MSIPIGRFIYKKFVKEKQKKASIYWNNEFLKEINKFVEEESLRMWFEQDFLNFQQYKENFLNNCTKQ